MGPSKDPCLAPDDPRNLWQFFNKIEQNDKKKWRPECQCCGQKYWDLSPYKIFDHFGYPLTRQTLLKYKPCSGIDKDEHKDVKATVQRIHAAEFAKKSALKLATAQGSRTQQATDDEFFHDRGVNVQAARASGHLPVSESPIRAAFASPAPRNSSTSAAESPVVSESPGRPVVQSRKLSEAAKEKLDEVWADAIYELALPFNLLDHPSMRTAINTTADLVRALRPLGVPHRSSEYRCCRGGA